MSFELSMFIILEKYGYISNHIFNTESTIALKGKGIFNYNFTVFFFKTLFCIEGSLFGDLL